MRPAPLLPLLLVVLVSGCGPKDETIEITDVRERKTAGPPPLLGRTDDERFGSKANPHGGGSDDTGGDPRFAWTNPEGWVDAPPTSSMVKLAWRITNSPAIECTFSTSGGTLLENVNRWAKQMSHAALDEAAVAALPRRTLLGLDAVAVEFDGTFVGMGNRRPVEGAKLLGLIAVLPATSAFLKMTGPAILVEAERARFAQLADSIRIETEAGPPPRVPPEAAARAPFQWSVPEGWEAKPASPPRVVTFVPKAAPASEAYVSLMSGDGGGLRLNLDMWRQGMGAAAYTDPEVEALPRATVLGKTATFCEIEGEGRTLLGMIVLLGKTAVFAKLIGPTEEVRGERERFRAFCESFHE